MNEIQDSHHAMHVESGCSRQWFHDGPCAPQDDREAVVARIAAVLRPMSDDLDLTGYPWDEQSPQGWRHKRLAAALYDAGLRSTPESPPLISDPATKPYQSPEPTEVAPSIDVPSVDDLEAALLITYPQAGADNVSGWPRFDAHRLHEALAARLAVKGGSDGVA